MKSRRTRAKMGRPPKPAGEVRSALVKLRVTEAEKRAMEAEAERAGQDVSAWLRSLAEAAIEGTEST